jgi:hypothetical protein
MPSRPLRHASDAANWRSLTLSNTSPNPDISLAQALL